MGIGENANVRTKERDRSFFEMGIWKERTPTLGHL